MLQDKQYEVELNNIRKAREEQKERDYKEYY